VFGEWAGQGVQKFVAISEAAPFFAVFAVVIIDERTDHLQLWTEPRDICALLDFVPGRPGNVHVLPWYTTSGNPEPASWTVNLNEPEEIKLLSETLNALVAEIDKCDPWAAEVLGIEGPGEGLVMYPDSSDSLRRFEQLAFKVKGETHLGPSQITKKKGHNPAILDIVDILKVGPRIVQAMCDIYEDPGFLRPLAKSDTAAVIRWVMNDIDRECGPEVDTYYEGELSAKDRKQIASFVCRNFHAHLKRSEQKQNE
jgi:hypothetical protein